ncbi:MAG: NIPSNAP family protein [Terriglobia bacterium]
MERRKFLASTLAASAAGLGASLAAFPGPQNAANEKGREYYELRSYHLNSGPQVKAIHEYFRGALLPALNRLGIVPVGVFNVVIGPENPSIYLLLPSQSPENLVNARLLLERDAEYVKAGAAFLNAPAAAPAFVRVESSLMIAFKGQPRPTIPPATAGHQARVFELRTYESPSDQDHQRKIEMFHSGEFDIFEKAGFWPVFYGDTLIGPRLPNLTYMLGFSDLAERNKLWEAFGSAPEWKKLTGSPRFAFEAIVSNITNLILSPTPYSQI